MADTKKAPQGVVAVLVGSDGVELANAADFDRSAPAGFKREEAQASRARRALALAAMRSLASNRLYEAIDAYTAEQIMRRMCDSHGCRVVVVSVGHED